MAERQVAAKGVMEVRVVVDSGVEVQVVAVMVVAAAELVA